MNADDLTIYAIIKNDDYRIKFQNELNNLVAGLQNGNLKLSTRNAI